MCTPAARRSRSLTLAGFSTSKSSRRSTVTLAGMSVGSVATREPVTTTVSGAGAGTAPLFAASRIHNKVVIPLMKGRKAIRTGVGLVYPHRRGLHVEDSRPDAGRTDHAR